ncbi:hypothetical protein V6N13_136523 [Hibiscus sabdariffa]|uniref:Uncharacterized protein n=2 Tax=Hibiscus sabdariffa TaxID=183260 RepID=A0ABR1ZB19_9ROSI
MDVLDAIIAAAVETALERKREENRRMSELLRAAGVALQQKAEECEMLKRKKQSMLAHEAAKQKLVDDFMLFIDNNCMENAQNFDEKAMMNDIFTMMNGGRDHIGGHNGGFAGSN